MTVDLAQLHAASDDFFKRHWPHSSWGAPPTWGQIWRFRGTMDGGDKQGVYALLSDRDEVLYIGVGASLGGGTYQGHGIGSRTASYCRMAPDQHGIAVPERRYVPVAKWQELGLAAIVTLGMEPDQAYLGYGLEAYLLSVLRTPHNSLRPARPKPVTSMP